MQLGQSVQAMKLLAEQPGAKLMAEALRSLL